MKNRKVRIAWSVVWGTACVALIVMWVRGHFYADYVKFGSPKSGVYDFISSDGEIWLYWNGDAAESTTEFRTIAPGVGVELPETSELGFAFFNDFSTSLPYWYVASPNWFLALTCAALGVAPWIRQMGWRFSLRSLLIAMTLIAVLLSLVVWKLKA